MRRKGARGARYARGGRGGEAPVTSGAHARRSERNGGCVGAGAGIPTDRDASTGIELRPRAPPPGRHHRPTCPKPLGRLALPTVHGSATTSGCVRRAPPSPALSPLNPMGERRISIPLRTARLASPFPTQLWGKGRGWGAAYHPARHHPYLTALGPYTITSMTPLTPSHPHTFTPPPPPAPPSARTAPPPPRPPRGTPSSPPPPRPRAGRTARDRPGALPARRGGPPPG